VFDCFGAGQRITQEIFGGRSWREAPELAAAQFAVLPVVRALHEMLWYLGEALTLPRAASLHDDVRRLRRRTEELAAGTPEQLRALDVGARRREVGELLQRVSERVRGRGRGRGKDRSRADLAGNDLRGVDLRGASLRGALLIGTDLRGVALGDADLLGADLRAADVRGTDLSTCLFLTQPQVSAARGDAGTAIPAVLRRPEHWGRAGQVTGPGR